MLLIKWKMLDVDWTYRFRCEMDETVNVTSEIDFNMEEAFDN